MDFGIKEELPIMELKEYKIYRNFPESRLEPENEFEEYAVAVIQESVVIGHLAKGKGFAFFLRTSDDNNCKVEVIRK